MAYSILEFLDNLKQQLEQTDNISENIVKVINELRAYYNYIKKTNSKDLKKINTYFDHLIGNLKKLSEHNFPAGAKSVLVQNIKDELTVLIDNIKNLRDPLAINEINKIESYFKFSIKDGLQIIEKGEGEIAVRKIINKNFKLGVVALVILLFFYSIIPPSTTPPEEQVPFHSNTWNDSIQYLIIIYSNQLKEYQYKRDSIDLLMKKLNNQGDLREQRRTFTSKIDSIDCIILPDIKKIKDYKNDVTTRRIRIYYNKINKK